MAHMIDMTGGRANMAFVGEVPWHGLGQSLTAGAPIETWLVEAGMNYKVCRSRVRYGEGAHACIWDDKHVLFRSDTKAPLGVVSERYKVVQPAEVVEFFRDLCDDNALSLETAGVLFGGARYWALARVPEGFSIAGDEVRGYILLATSADGSLATTAKHTSTRVVCNNTLSIASADGSKHAVRVKHSTTFDAQAVKIDMGLLTGEFDAFAGQCETLARKPISKRDAVHILVGALGDSETFMRDIGTGVGVAKAIENQPNKRVMGEIVSLFDGRAIGSELVSSRGTAWGLVNATTEYYDHRAGRQDRSPALASAWFGPAAQAKEKVFAEAYRVAQAA